MKKFLTILMLGMATNFAVQAMDADTYDVGGPANAEAAVCTICQEDIKEGEVVKRLSCGHCFHRSCLNPVVRTACRERLTFYTCPNCRHQKNIGPDSSLDSEAFMAAALSERLVDDIRNGRGSEGIFEIYFNGGVNPLMVTEGGTTLVHEVVINGQDHLLIPLLMVMRSRTLRNDYITTVNAPTTEDLTITFPDDKKVTLVAGQTALHTAVLLRRIPCVVALISKNTGINIDSTSDGLTALLMAIEIEEHEAAHHLIEAGADVNKGDQWGATPLIISVIKQSPLFEDLLSHPNILVDTKIKSNCTDGKYLLHEGMSALHIACITNEGNKAKRLLEHGAGVHSTDAYNCTPLMCAIFYCKKDNKGIIGTLINEYGCDVATALTEDALFGYNRDVDLPEQEESSVQTLFDSGTTALHMATYFQDIETVVNILHNAVDVNAQTTIAGQTSLHIAVMSGNIYLVISLVTHPGVDVDIPTNDSDVLPYDKRQATPLHLAAMSGHKDIVILLVHHKADPKKRNKSGWTPSELAQENGHQAVVEYLDGLNG